MEFNFKNIFTCISIFSGGIYLFYCILKIRPKLKQCITYNSPTGSQFDYSIFRDCALRALLLGGSMFLFLHAMYFGVTDKWLLPYQSYMKSIIVVIGAIYYLVNIIQSAINYVNNEIKRRIEINSQSLINNENKSQQKDSHF